MNTMRSLQLATAIAFACATPACVNIERATPPRSLSKRATASTLASFDGVYRNHSDQKSSAECEQSGNCSQTKDGDQLFYSLYGGEHSHGKRATMVDVRSAP